MTAAKKPSVEEAVLSQSLADIHRAEGSAAQKRKEGHGVIVFSLKEHWERGQKLPAEPGVYTRPTKAG